MSIHQSSWVLAILAATLWFGRMRPQHPTLASDKPMPARQNQTEAEAKAPLAEQYLYAARMNLAQAAWVHSQTQETIRLLNLYDPAMGNKRDDDLRGFEWHYWTAQAHSCQRSLPSQHVWKCDVQS